MEGRAREKVSSVRSFSMGVWTITVLIPFSSSWYNVPPAITSKGKSKQNADDVVAKSSTSAAHVGEVAHRGGDSTPLNFDTFVPTHDASLAVAAGPLLTVPAMDGVSSTGAGAEAAAVSQDEAFSRAMTAMYWSGYWTAVYHVSLFPCVRPVASDPNHMDSVAGPSPRMWEVQKPQTTLSKTRKTTARKRRRMKRRCYLRSGEGETGGVWQQ